MITMSEIEGLRYAMELAVNRAACGNWALPETPSDLLAWAIDELNVHISQLESNPSEFDLIGTIKILTAAVLFLYKQGYRPAALPWEKKQ